MVAPNTVAEEPAADVQIVHMRGSSAIRRPLIVLAVCAVGALGYLARDFLIPTAGAIVLALILTPVANMLERLRLPPAPAAGVAVLILTLFIAGILAVAIPSISTWAEQGPWLGLTLERKLEGLRKSVAFMQELTDWIEKAASGPPHQAAPPPEKVVVQERSLLSTLASTTPAVLLQIGYAGVLAVMLLAHRNAFRRQIMRIPATFYTRVRLARVMRDINERVGHYLFSVTVIYCGVAAAASLALALLGLPNAVMWGAFLGLASFVPYVGPPIIFIAVAFVALLTFDDWLRIAAAPAILAVIHFVESQFITPALVSRRCALNSVAVFTAIALLGWMWGAVGAIVAVPLLILISTVAAHLPSLRWLEVLLADDRPPSPRVAAKPPLSVAPGRRPPQVRRRLVAAR
jgi:predicted PurR-regulated permease PerM